MTDRKDTLGRAESVGERALRLHAFYRGKMQTMPKVPLRGPEDLALWYTPGVAAVSRAIAEDPAAADRLTNRANSVALVTDGSRVPGLGDVGPAAALPVMEGKALLFKLLGGLDAVPLCLDTRDPAEIVRAVELIAPSFGAINLEDIAQPKCFAVLERLRARLSIPVWHDDQQGTATVVLAALTNALAVVGKDLGAVRIAMIGMGAVNVATYRLLTAAGADPKRIVACDSQGVLHPGRADIAAERGRFADKWRVCRESNGAGVTGGIAEALAGADVCLAFSTPVAGTIRPAWIARMTPPSIVFAGAGPTPEIAPAAALRGGAAIVASGCAEGPNQIANALVYPGLFRGALDVRARAISEGMALAAARALAALGRQRGLSGRTILPPPDDPEAPLRVAVAVAMAAEAEGLASLPLNRTLVAQKAQRAVAASRDSLEALRRAGTIALPPRLA